MERVSFRLLSGCLLSLAAFPTYSQNTTEEKSDAATVVVTGTRITSDGFSAPTPTQVLSADDLQKVAQPNIFTAITRLPSLQGSTGTNTGTFSTSSGMQGLSSFSLRGLGAIRTLTLLGGQRVIAANVTGVPDISQFPQLLVERVDLVNTGITNNGLPQFVYAQHAQSTQSAKYGLITNGPLQGTAFDAAGRARSGATIPITSAATTPRTST